MVSSCLSVVLMVIRMPVLILIISSEEARGLLTTVKQLHTLTTILTIKDKCKTYSIEPKLINFSAKPR